jgi:hypothetical protein
MTSKEKIQQEIEETLQSLDGVKRAEANPFLFTRIKAGWIKANRWRDIFFYKQTGNSNCYRCSYGR